MRGLRGSGCAGARRLGPRNGGERSAACGERGGARGRPRERVGPPGCGGRPASLGAAQAAPARACGVRYRFGVICGRAVAPGRACGPSGVDPVSPYTIPPAQCGGAATFGHNSLLCEAEHRAAMRPVGPLSHNSCYVQLARAEPACAGGMV